jgi:hypothetical protein
MAAMPDEPTQDDLEQMAEDWPRVRKEIADLKKQNGELKQALVNVVILERTLYAYIGTDKMSGNAEKLRGQIVSVLNGLHTLLEIPGP